MATAMTSSLVSPQSYMAYGERQKRRLSPRTETLGCGYSRRSKAARGVRSALFQTRCELTLNRWTEVSHDRSSTLVQLTPEKNNSWGGMPKKMVQVPLTAPIVEDWNPEDADLTTSEPELPSLSSYDAYSINDPSTPTKLHHVFPYKRDLGKRYLVGQELGRGSFGTVRLGRCKEDTNLLIAIKSLPKLPPKAARPAKGEMQLSNYLRKLEAEVSNMKVLRKEGTAVRFVDRFEDDSHVHLVMQLCRGGTLQRRLKVEGAMSERETALTIWTTLQFLEGCHAQGVVYRDIKPENFMYTHARHMPDAVAGLAFHEVNAVKVVDFGQAILLDNECAMICRRSGTPAYMAPEVIKQCYGAKADMWCTGMMMYQLLSNRLPFWKNIHDHDLKEVWTAILQSKADFSGEPWNTVSDGAKDVISQLLRKDPKKRPSACELKQHPWFREVLGDDLVL